MQPERLADVQHVTIKSDVVLATLDTLQAYGDHGFEGLVLWLGEIKGSTAVIYQALVPDQEPVSSESGVGYFVDGETLFRLNRALANSGMRLIAQVHSHPTNAYHSETDDKYAIVTAEGGLSFVVPNFGKASLDPRVWAIYRLTRGEWRVLNDTESLSLISVSV
jgi:hypothetical protein